MLTAQDLAVNIIVKHEECISCKSMKKKSSINSNTQSHLVES